MLNLKNLLYPCVILAIFVSVDSALAANLPPPPPPPSSPPVVVIEKADGCFYASFGSNFIVHNSPRVYKNSTGTGSNAVGEKMNDTGSVDIGVGCRAIDGLRTELNAGYRLETRLTDSFNSLDVDVESFTGMGNIWWDIYDVFGVKPYVGGGVGIAFHSIEGCLPACSSGNKIDITFAWQVGGGIGVEVIDNLVLDLGYRFTDLGRPESSGTFPFYIDDFQSHEFRFGLRYDLGGLM